MAGLACGFFHRLTSTQHDHVGQRDLLVAAGHPVEIGTESFENGQNVGETVLYDEPFWIAMPNGHTLTDQEVIDVTQIEPGDLLLLSDGHCLRDQIYDACKIDRARHRPQAGPRIQKTSLSTIFALVGAGEGITLVPAMSLAAEWITDSGIAVRPEESGTAGRTIRLTYRSGYPRMALVEKLADIIAASLPNTVHPVRR